MKILNKIFNLWWKARIPPSGRGGGVPKMGKPGTLPLGLPAALHFIQWTVYLTGALHLIRALHPMMTLRPMNTSSNGHFTLQEHFIQWTLSSMRHIRTMRIFYPKEIESIGRSVFIGWSVLIGRRVHWMTCPYWMKCPHWMKVLVGWSVLSEREVYIGWSILIGWRSLLDEVSSLEDTSSNGPRTLSKCPLDEVGYRPDLPPKYEVHQYQETLAWNTTISIYAQTLVEGHLHPAKLDICRILGSVSLTTLADTPNIDSYIQNFTQFFTKFTSIILFSSVGAEQNKVCWISPTKHQYASASFWRVLKSGAKRSDIPWI
jgi:hypothetical protein